MGVKIFDGQGFHVGEKPVTELSHGPLADIYHDPVVHICCRDTDDIKNYDPHQRVRQRREVRILRIQQRHDIIVHKRLYEQHPLHGCKGTNNDTDYNHKERKFIILHHVCQKPFQDIQ